MARTRKGHTAPTRWKLGLRSPMWAGVALAAVSWIALGQLTGAWHGAAGSPASPLAPGLARTLEYARIVVPLLCLVIAGLWSALGRTPQVGTAARPSGTQWIPAGSHVLHAVLTRALERQGDRKSVV